MIYLTNISISLVQFLIIGIPQGFLFVLAIYLLTGTNFDQKKYLILSSAATVFTYLIRFLPITLGVNTMLSLLSLIILFLVVYKFQLDLPKSIRLIVSVIAIFIFICFSELMNELILVVLFGKARTEQLFNSGSDLIRSVSMIPTNAVLAVLILISYIVIKKKVDYGKTGAEIGGPHCKNTGL